VEADVPPASECSRKFRAPVSKTAKREHPRLSAVGMGSNRKLPADI